MKKIIMFLILILCALSINAAAAEGDYIIVLKDNAKAPPADIAEPLFPDAGIYLVHSLEDISDLGGSVESYEADEAIPLCAYPDEPDDMYFNMQWNLDAIHAEYARQMDIRGEGVTVAIIDSGVQRSNPDLINQKVLDGVSFVDDGIGAVDDISHGTMVAGIIAAQSDNGVLISGIADKVTILPIKATYGFILNESTALKGLNAAYEMGCDVVNLSMGASFKLALDAAVTKLTDNGAIVCAASGNEGNAPVEYPARYENVISVGSTTIDNERSGFSTYNIYLDCVAPGSNITSLNYKDPGSYLQNSGTSFSTPHCVALAALAKSVDPDLDTDGFRELLKKSCTDLGPEGFDVEYGYGLINVEEMLKIQLAESGNPVSIYGSYENSGKTVYKIRSIDDGVTANAVYAEYNDRGMLTALNQKDIELNEGAEEISFDGGGSGSLYLLDKRTAEPLASYSV